MNGATNHVAENAYLWECTIVVTRFFKVVLKENGLHSISFPLISSGIFGGSLDNPPAESTKQCLRAYKKFVADYPDYGVDVKLCAFSSSEMIEAQKVYEEFGL